MTYLLLGFLLNNLFKSKVDLSTIKNLPAIHEYQTGTRYLCYLCYHTNLFLHKRVIESTEIFSPILIFRNPLTVSERDINRVIAMFNQIQNYFSNLTFYILSRDAIKNFRVLQYH